MVWGERKIDLWDLHQGEQDLSGHTVLQGSKHFWWGGQGVVSKAAQANGASRGLKGNGILGERWG